MNWRPIIFCSMVFLYTARACAASDSTAIPHKGSLRILTNIDSAIVFIDSARIGQTPLTVDSLFPGTHYLRLVHPDLSNWLTRAINDSVRIGEGESRTVRYDFELWYRVTSVPSEARVLAGDSLVGTTPFIWSAPGPHADSVLTLKKEGFEAAQIVLSGAPRGSLVVPLKKLWDPDLITGSTSGRATGPKPFPLWASGSTAVLSGIVAAYFKIRADERNDAYLLSGDPSLISETHHLDSYAAVALAVMQISIGFFMYFLLAD